MTERNQNTSEKRVRKSHRDFSKINLVITVLTVLGNLLTLFTLFNVTQFASLSKPVFIFLNVIVLVIQLIINVLVISAVNSRKIRNYTLGMLFAVILFAVGAAGTFTVIRVNSSISNITNTTVQESVSTSFVIYDSEDDFAITNVDGLEGKTVGFAAGTSTGDLGKNQIDSRSLNVNLE